MTIENRRTHKKEVQVLQGNNTTISEEYLLELKQRFETETPGEILQWGYHHFGNKIVLGTGFGPSGVVLIHKICLMGLPIRVFCLDTHLLFDETYSLWEEIEETFDITIESVSPILTLEGQAELHKDKLWMSDPDRCCYLRKVLPLQKYLTNKDAWITGLRRSQSEARRRIGKIEWDRSNKVCKINPLADWNGDQVWNYIHEHNLPYNPLHDEGFPSIGCIPCTEAATNQDERSGRWKNLDKTECGIHLPGLEDEE